VEEARGGDNPTRRTRGKPLRKKWPYGGRDVVIEWGGGGGRESSGCQKDGREN